MKSIPKAFYRETARVIAQEVSTQLESTGLVLKNPESGDGLLTAILSSQLQRAQRHVKDYEVELAKPPCQRNSPEARLLRDYWQHRADVIAELLANIEIGDLPFAILVELI